MYIYRIILVPGGYNHYHIVRRLQSRPVLDRSKVDYSLRILVVYGTVAVLLYKYKRWAIMRLLYVLSRTHRHFTIQVLVYFFIPAFGSALVAGNKYRYSYRSKRGFKVVGQECCILGYRYYSNL